MQFGAQRIPGAGHPAVIQNRRLCLSPIPMCLSQACVLAAGRRGRSYGVRWAALCSPCLAMPCGWNTGICSAARCGDATTAGELQGLLAGLARQGRWVMVYHGWHLPDERDNHLIELELAGGAQAIMTHNLRDLRGGKLRLGNLRVLTPAQCLEEWK